MRTWLTVGLLLLALNAHAETTAKQWADEAEERATRIGTLAQDDLTGEAAPQLEVARGLLNRVQGHLANEDLDPLPRLFARINRMLEWVAAMEVRMVAEKNAEALEQEAAFAVDEAAKAEQLQAELQARYDELEEKGL